MSAQASIPLHHDDRGRLRGYVRFAALGDSATYGIGDRTRGGARGWARLLAVAVATQHDVSFANLAVPGATTSEVRALQLPQAAEHRAQVASLVIGINDTLRSTWSAASVRQDLLAVAERLADDGALLLTVRFHDHARVFRLPGRLGRALGDRISTLNEVYDELYDRFDGIRVDLGAHPGVYDREFWAADRLHPSELGHRALAHEFAAGLHERGLTFTGPALALDGLPPSRPRELTDVAREGVPWLIRRIRDLGPSFVRTALRSTHVYVGDVRSSPDVPGEPSTTRCDRRHKPGSGTGAIRSRRRLSR